MRIFDIHTHVYPDAVAQKATDSVKEFYGIPGAGLDGKVSTLLQQGQKVGISGYLLDVNPFDQPGVEAYKKNMFALLGKPGYEDMKAELEARIK